MKKILILLVLVVNILFARNMPSSDEEWNQLGTISNKEYVVQINKNGAVLKPVNETEKIYLGKDCDVYSKTEGKGRWGFFRRSPGFRVEFSNGIILETEKYGKDIDSEWYINMASDARKCEISSMHRTQQNDTTFKNKGVEKDKSKIENELKMKHMEQCNARYEFPFSHKFERRLITRLYKNGIDTEWYNDVNSIDLPSIGKHLETNDEKRNYHPSFFFQSFYKDNTEYQAKLKARLFIVWAKSGRELINFVNSNNKELIVNAIGQQEIFTNITSSTDATKLLQNCHKKIKQKQLEFFQIDLAIVIFIIMFLVLLFIVIKKFRNKQKTK